MSNIESYQNISTLFKATRKFYGLLQSEFAKILGVTQGTVSKIEAGTMTPDLGVWFKLLRSFKILDPYCFTYSGLEFSQDNFDLLKINGSTLAPKFNFQKNNYISNVRKIRPLFEYLQAKNSKILARFLEEQSVSIELFYILNHPLSSDFIESFFSYLDESKMNSKSFAMMDLDFHQSLGRQYDELISSQNAPTFFELLNNDSQNLAKYELSKNKNEYYAIIDKKNISTLDELNKSDFILNYNLLYPFQILKSLKGTRNTIPVIYETQDKSMWRIAYAS